MTQFVGRIFASIFGHHSALATLIISMFPIIEIKGAIPVGMSEQFFGEYALNGTQALIFSLIGSSLVVPIIALIFTPLVKWLKSTRVFARIGQFIENKVKRASGKITKDTADENKTEIDRKKATRATIVKMLGVLVFVAIPIPLTGVWTGTCVGVAVGLKFWQTCLSVIVGNIIASLIITFVCSVFPQITTILFFVVLAFVGVIIIYSIVKFFVSKNDKALEQSDKSTQNGDSDKNQK